MYSGILAVAASDLVFPCSSNGCRVPVPTLLKTGRFSDRVCHLILPMTVVVLSHLWYYAYMIRNILDEVREEYVLLAKPRG